jgi:hypothetical protein
MPTDAGDAEAIYQKPNTSRRHPQHKRLNEQQSTRDRKGVLAQPNALLDGPKRNRLLQHPHCGKERDVMGLCATRTAGMLLAQTKSLRVV